MQLNYESRQKKGYFAVRLTLRVDPPPQSVFYPSFFMKPLWGGWRYQIGQTFGKIPLFQKFMLRIFSTAGALVVITV